MTEAAVLLSSGNPTEKCNVEASNQSNHDDNTTATASHKNGVEVYSLYVLLENVVKMLPIILKV